MSSCRAKCTYIHLNPAIGVDRSCGFIYCAVVITLLVWFETFWREKHIFILTPCLFLFVQNACSVSRAAKQPPPADLKGLGIGTSRLEVIQRLGAPKFSETDAEGKKQETYEFQSGMHGASKLRIIFYLAGDIVTLGLAEFIFWPMELTLLKSASCNAAVTYDTSQKVETFNLSQTAGVQGC